MDAPVIGLRVGLLLTTPWVCQIIRLMMEHEAAVPTERREGACNLCGASDAQPVFTGHDPLSGEAFPVVRCGRCGLSYVHPRPSIERLSHYYPEAYYGKRHPFFANFMNDLRVRKLPRLRGAQRLLDIGCGRGDFILRCRARGWSVAGVEQSHSPVIALKAALGIDVYEPDDLASIAAESFDVVTLWHVLEHLPDPASTLAEVRRILKPGGTVLIEVPNFGGWDSRLGGPTWFHLDVPRHLFHFEREPLSRLLHGAGLTPQRWETFSLEYDAFSVVQTLLNRLCSRPNHLFQLLIRRGHTHARSVKDTVVSLAALPALLPLALVVSALAARRHAGGVLRVWAEKRGLFAVLHSE